MLPRRKQHVSCHGVVYSAVLGAAAFNARAHVVPMRDTGAKITPFNAFLILRGSTALRLERINGNTHRRLNDEDLIKAGATDNTVHLSVGIVHVDDLMADLEQALASVQKDGHFTRCRSVRIPDLRPGVSARPETAGPGADDGSKIVNLQWRQHESLDRASAAPLCRHRLRHHHACKFQEVLNSSNFVSGGVFDTSRGFPALVQNRSVVAS